MSGVELEVLVSGINEPQADYLEQKNIDIEKKLRPGKEKNVLNRRNQITSEAHFEEVVKQILADSNPEIKRHCPG
jgi:hypothetical protein